MLDGSPVEKWDIKIQSNIDLDLAFNSFKHANDKSNKWNLASHEQF
jgi:hypothetical protein